MIVELRAPSGQDAVVIEDDGRVAYAYLVKARKIVAAVWLYNRCECDEAEWTGERPPPFANSKRYTIGEAVAPIAGAHEVDVDWGERPAPRASIRIRGQLWATLNEGDRPGRRRLAKRASPIARPLDAPSAGSSSRARGGRSN